MPLYFLRKLLLLFSLCIRYKQRNLQAKITYILQSIQYFTQQSKIFYNSKSGLLFFLKLQSTLMYTIVIIIDLNRIAPSTEMYEVFMQVINFS